MIRIGIQFWSDKTAFRPSQVQMFVRIAMQWTTCNEFTYFDEQRRTRAYRTVVATVSVYGCELFYPKHTKKKGTSKRTTCQNRPYKCQYITYTLARSLARLVGEMSKPNKLTDTNTHIHTQRQPLANSIHLHMFRSFV